MQRIRRKVIRTAILVTLSWQFVVVGTTMGLAQLLERSVNGAASSVIDWKRGYIETTARGTARFTGNVVQEELMALEAARVLAKAGLVELLHGVRVTGATTVGDFITRDSTARAQFSGILKGAVPLGETVEWIDDKSAKRGRVVVGRATYRVCLLHEDEDCRKGALAVVDFLTPVSKSGVRHARDTVQGRVGPVRQSTDHGPIVSGLIIDLGSKLFLPVLSPEIVSENGTVVFNMAMVTRRHLTGNSTVRYTQALKTARKMMLIGSRPIIVPAVEVKDDNRIVVAEESAKKIAEAVKAGATFLAEGRVVIALDK